MAKARAKRYFQILELIEQCKPWSIIEVGVWNGDRAIAMATAALKHRAVVHYSGFDLFEDATPETNVDELNAKSNQTVASVSNKLNQFADRYPGFSFTLMRGNTRETLKPQIADFVYIDGGHSVETIRSDYEALRESPVIVFDDYYRPDSKGNGADLSRFGANAIVDQIPGSQVLDSTDPLNVGGTVHLAVVRL